MLHRQNGALWALPAAHSLPRLARYGEIFFDNFAMLVGVIRRRFAKADKGQTALEYIVLIIIVLGALLTIQHYFKRGLQGRWKTAVDDMGDQYDPRAADSAVRHTLVQSTNTFIIATPLNALDPDSSYWTQRTDESLSTEQKQGTVEVGAY